MVNLILALAVWRLSSLLVYEDGPWFIFRRLRKRVRAGEFGGDTLDGNRLAPEEIAEAMKKAAQPRPFLGELISCLWCTSVWVAGGLTLFQRLVPGAQTAVTPFALSAAAIFADSLHKYFMNYSDEREQAKNLQEYASAQQQKQADPKAARLQKREDQAKETHKQVVAEKSEV